MALIIGSVIVVVCVFWWFARRSDERAARNSAAPCDRSGDNRSPTVDQMNAGLQQVARKDEAIPSISAPIAPDTFDEAASQRERFFERAYWQACSSLDAPRGALENLLPPLTAGYCNGDHDAMYEAVFQHLPETVWRWPVYEAHILREQTSDCSDELRAIKGYSIDDLLTCQSVAELRLLCKEFCPDLKKSPGRKKAEIFNTLFSRLSAEQKNVLAERLRDEMLNSIQKPGVLDYRDMVVRLCSRLSTLAYNEERKAQILGYEEHCREVEFVADSRYGIPAECKRRDGRRFRVDDPIWDRLPPCEYLECQCRIHPIFK